MIIRVSVVLRRTVCGDFDWRFDNLSGSHWCGSKRTNHFLQSSQPITSRLTDKRPITSGLRWPIRLTTRDVYTTYRRSTIHLTLKMTSAQVVETSVKVTTNSPSQDYTHPDDHNLRTYDMTPGFKPFATDRNITQTRNGRWMNSISSIIINAEYSRANVVVCYYSAIRKQLKSA